MRIDWIAWQKRSTKAIYPLYRELKFKDGSFLYVLENKYKEFKVYYKYKLIGNNLSEREATNICEKIVDENVLNHNL